MDKSQSLLWLVKRSQCGPLIGWPPCPGRATLFSPVWASDSGEGECDWLVITGSVGTSPASSGPQHSEAVSRRVRACADYHGALPSPSLIQRAESRCNCVKPEIQSDVRQQTIKVTSQLLSFLGDLWYSDQKYHPVKGKWHWLLTSSSITSMATIGVRFW